jgi:hypothetical protein
MDLRSMAMVCHSHARLIWPHPHKNGQKLVVGHTVHCGDRFRVAVPPYSSALISVMYSVQSQL